MGGRDMKNDLIGRNSFLRSRCPDCKKSSNECTCHIKVKEVTLEEFNFKRKKRPEFPFIDKSSWFYKNCVKQRRSSAKICQCCPFRKGIEMQEK